MVVGAPDDGFVGCPRNASMSCRPAPRHAVQLVDKDTCKHSGERQTAKEQNRRYLITVFVRSVVHPHSVAVPFNGFITHALVLTAKL